MTVTAVRHYLWTVWMRTTRYSLTLDWGLRDGPWYEIHERDGVVHAYTGLFSVLGPLVIKGRGRRVGDEDPVVARVNQTIARAKDARVKYRNTVERDHDRPE